MLDTSARLLRLLSLMQSHADWTGSELAARMKVSLRTLRRDVDRLRELGYPVEATSGVAGGYRLGAGASLPPLLLDDDEAVAVVISLRTAATGSVNGLEESALRALAKVQHVLPAHLRHRVSAFEMAAVPLPGAAATGPGVDPELLSQLAAACRDQRRTRLHYTGRDEVTSRHLEPYRLVHTPRRWYLLAWDIDKEDWRTFRVDRVVAPLGPPGPRFPARPLPEEDVAAFVSRSLSSRPYPYQAKILFHAPVSQVSAQTSATAGHLEAVDEGSCLYSTGSSSLNDLALYIAVKGFDFTVIEPPELVTVLDQVADRLRRAGKSLREGERGQGPGWNRTS